jgi:hypothetical protein
VTFACNATGRSVGGVRQSSIAQDLARGALACSLLGTAIKELAHDL